MTGYTLNGYPYMEPTDPAGTVAEHQRLLAEKIDDERGGTATLLRRTANLTIPNGLGTPTVVPWQVEDFDTLDGFALGAPSYVTLPPNGVYLANAGVQWAGQSPPAGQRVIELTLDGIVQAGDVINPLAANNHVNNQSTAGMFLVGSTPGLLRLQLLQNSGGNLDAQAGKTSAGSSGLWMSVQRIGAL